MAAEKGWDLEAPQPGYLSSPSLLLKAWTITRELRNFGSIRVGKSKVLGSDIIL